MNRRGSFWLGIAATLVAGAALAQGAAPRAVSPSMTGGGAEHAALLMAHPAAPDAAMFGATVERATEHGPSLVSAWFAPTPRGNCDVGYDMVNVWSKSCQEVAREVFNQTQPLPVIGRGVAIIALAATHHIYLIGAPAGCVSIRKQMIYP